MRLPRMTTRRWMIGVAVVALLMGVVIGGYRLKRRHDNFAARARHHAMTESFLRQSERDANQFLKDSAVVMGPIREYQRSRGTHELSRIEDLEAFVDRRRNEAETLPPVIAYHAAMAQKYRRAARYPWLPVEPDPPEPE